MVRVSRGTIGSLTHVRCSISNRGVQYLERNLNLSASRHKTTGGNRPSETLFSDLHDPLSLNKRLSQTQGFSPTVLEVLE